MHLLAGLCGAAGVAVVQFAAGAAALHIDCPALDEENLAALEARARAELAASPLPAGEIDIECQLGAARVAWRRADGRLFERNVTLEPDPTTTVDDLLAAVHALRFQITAPAPETRPTTPSVALALAPPQSSYGFGALFGLESELWRGAIGGALGARLGARLSLPRRWSVTVGGGIGWGLAAAQGIRARTVRADAAITYTPLRRLELGLGPEIVILQADASGPATPGTNQALTEGAVAFMRLALVPGRFKLSVGPKLEVLARPLVVQVADSELFRIPALVLGVFVDGESDLAR